MGGETVTRQLFLTPCNVPAGKWRSLPAGYEKVNIHAGKRAKPLNEIQRHRTALFVFFIAFKRNRQAPWLQIVATIPWICALLSCAPTNQ